MYFKIISRGILYSIFTLIAFNYSLGDTLSLTDTLEQKTLRRSYLGILEDRSGQLTIGQIASEFSNRFEYGNKDLPMNDHTSSAYWLKFSLKNESVTHRKFLLEIFDHNIQDIKLYEPDGKGGYKEYIAGNRVSFGFRTFNHKNFEFDLPVPQGETYTFYMRVQSSNAIMLAPMIRSYKKFIGYALGEYIVLGIFYGILLMMAIYNLFLYIAIKRKAYLLYVIYVLSICLFSTSQTGLGFQYIWSSFPVFNQYAFGIFLYTAIISALLFTTTFLDLKEKFPLLHTIILSAIGIRSLLFITGFIYPPFLFTMSFDSIPLLIAYACGVIVYERGNRSAKYFVFAYSILFTGFIVNILEQYGLLPSSIFTVYSLNIAAILDVIFLSVSLTDKMRTEIRLKEEAQERVVVELKEKELLKDKVTQELETKVAERTEELRLANELLAKQAEEITSMNLMLDLQNRDLKKNVKEVTRDRVMRNYVDLKEFTGVYPDDLSCYRFLEELKNESGFVCKKCASTHCGKGKETFDRRCTSCGYNESVTANTIFHKLKFPIVKAFYIMYLVSNKKDITAEEMSEKLDLRKNTCYNFKNKILERMRQHPAGKLQSWDELILDSADIEKEM